MPKQILLSLLLSTVCNSVRKPRNIIVLLGDDIGWNEVSWHNPTFLTPNLEKLKSEGVLLTQSYVTPKCSPSRAALMTGLYPWRFGMQRGAVERFQPDGLNTSLKILPEYLKDAGYATHAVGKWHLGYCHPSYLPTNRGFDSHIGSWTHTVDYYNRMVDYRDFPQSPEDMKGYDWHYNGEVSYEGDGEFSPDFLSRKSVDIIESHNSSSGPLFLYVAFQSAHGPISKPPQEYLDLYRNIRISPHHLNRAATITALDAGIGRIVKSLKSTGLYKNSIILFSTDNGGSVEGYSNRPLKGNKEMLYEGGVRGVALVTGKMRKRLRGSENSGLMYITDWFSTFLDLAGLKADIPDTADSFSMWRSWSGLTHSPRDDIVLNMDRDEEKGLWSAALRKGKYKLIWGQSKLLKQKMPKDANKRELYNVIDDPNETKNLAGSNPEIVSELQKILRRIEPQMASARYSRPIKDGWPGRQKGRSKGMHVTG